MLVSEIWLELSIYLCARSVLTSLLRVIEITRLLLGMSECHSQMSIGCHEQQERLSYIQNSAPSYTQTCEQAFWPFTRAEARLQALPCQNNIDKADNDV